MAVMEPKATPARFARRPATTGTTRPSPSESRGPPSRCSNERVTSGRSISSAASIPPSARRSCSRWQAPTRAASAASPIGNGRSPKAFPRPSSPRSRGWTPSRSTRGRGRPSRGHRPTPAATSPKSPTPSTSTSRQHFSAQEQADIELVARTMYWMNEASNGVRAGLKRVKRTPVPGSTVPRELEALLLYAVGAPLVLVLLSVKQRRNPISLDPRDPAVLPRVRLRAVQTRSPGRGELRRQLGLGSIPSGRPRPWRCASPGFSPCSRGRSAGGRGASRAQAESPR